MKKIALLVVAAGFAAVAFTPARKLDSSFEGIIAYSVTVDGGTDQKSQQAAAMMKNSTMTFYIKPGKFKSVMSYGMGKQTAINDVSSDSAVVLMDMGQQKFMSKVANKKGTDAKAAAITYSDETKTIAGYVCKKASIASSTAGGDPTIVYYTDQLPSYDGKAGEYKGLKGFPLQFSSTNHGMTMTFTATTVTKQTVSDDEYKIPDGYKRMAGMGMSH